MGFRFRNHGILSDMTPDPPNAPEVEVEPGTPGGVSIETNRLLLKQARANRRLRTFAYLVLGVVAIAAVASVIIGALSLTGLQQDLSTSKDARDSNRQLLQRSVNSSVQGQLYLNAAFKLLVDLNNNQQVSRTQVEQELVKILQFNGFKIPPGIPKPLPTGPLPPAITPSPKAG